MSQKERAIGIIKRMSDERLHNTLKKFGYDVPVNFLTRRAVENKIEEKLEGYTDTQISNFIDEHIA
jgi:hypothetical protein